MRNTAVRKITNHTTGNNSAKRATLARLDPQLHNAADGKPECTGKHQTLISLYDSEKTNRKRNNKPIVLQDVVSV